MKKNILSQAVLLASASLAGGQALAVEPQTIEAGMFDLIPTVSSSYKHTDNMFRSDANEVSSNLFIVSPRIEAVTGNGNSTLSLVGQIDEGNWSATAEDDYTDWLLGASGQVNLSGNQSLDLHASRFRTREERGTGFSQGGFLPGAPDRYEETKYGGAFTVGTNESFGRVVVNLDWYDKDYKNNKLTTQFREREDFTFGGTLYLNMSSRTALLFEYRDRDVDYTTDPLAVIGAPDSLDSSEQYMFVGVEWQATGKTTGSFRIGSGDKEFDDGDRADADLTAWEAGIQWEALPYSVVNFTAANTFDEATGVGNALERRNYGINWQHGWNDQLSSTVVWDYSDDQYTGSQRDDTIEGLNVRLDYNVQRWLDVFVSVGRDKRDSNFGNFNYDQNVATVGVSASL